MQRCSKRRKTGYLRGAANVVSNKYLCILRTSYFGSMPDTSWLSTAGDRLQSHIQIRHMQPMGHSMSITIGGTMMSQNSLFYY